MKISRSIALEIFGLKEDFSQSDLRKEYRRLVKIVHPDTGGDEQLFKFIDSCRLVLLNGENISEDTNKTNNHKSNSYKNSNTSERANACISLEDLDDVYPLFLRKYEEEYNIVEIRASLLISIRPIFRKKLEKRFVVDAVFPYSNLNKSVDAVIFNQTIKIPREMQKFRRFKICVKLLDRIFKFSVSDGNFKVIEHKRYNYIRCLKSICELHFEK